MVRSLKHAALSTALALATLGAGSASAYYTQSTVAYDTAPAPSLLSTVSACDDCSQVVNLPWAFPFYGRSFTQLTVSSNGYLVLGNTTAATFSNPPLAWEGTTSAPAGTLAPMWDDWHTGNGGDVYAGQVGTAYVVEWRNVYRLGQTSGIGYTFKVKLFSDGAFEFHYGNTVGGASFADSGASSTSGYQEGTDTVGHPLSFDQAVLTSSTARRFTRPGNVALFVNVRDGLFNEHRSGLLYTLPYTCTSGSTTFTSSLSATSTSSATFGGWTRTVASPVCTSLSLGASTFHGDVNGWSVSTYPLAGGVIERTSGTYRFIRRADVTPRQSFQQAFNVTYGGSTTRRSVLDYWVSGAFDKPLVIITGFDPLNEDSTANYLMLMGDLVRTLRNEGFDIAIGKYGDGNQRLGWFRGEAAAWIEDAAARLPAGGRVQVAGISQGGIVLRDTLFNNVNSVTSRVKAWYSIDSPQLGANLGRAYRGVQNLVLCNKPSTDPSRVKLTSAPAYDLMYNVATSCSCDNEPENSTCTASSAFHSAYYGTIGWPSASIPRYALAFADANPNNGFAKNGSNSNLYDFTYTGWFCSEDRDWEPGQRDCVAGSRSITASDINTDESASLCGTFRLRLTFEPAFINADSALAVSGNALSTEAASPGCGANYSTLTPTQWTGWASNDYNENHEVLTTALANQLLTWVRANQ